MELIENYYFSFYSSLGHVLYISCR